MNLWQIIVFWRVPDYLMIAIITVVAAVVGAKVRPHCRPFRWTDATISYPYRSDTFPMKAVAIAVVFVALLMIIGEVLTRVRRGLRRSYTLATGVGPIRSMLLHVNGWILVQLYSILLAFTIVNVSKVYAGRLRPDFLARLAREGITSDTADFDSMNASGPICDRVREGRLSFPSGHSGTIFSGYVPPTMYLMGLTRSLHTGSSYFVLTLCLLPLILPITVAISRTIDFRHNFDDVVTGSCIGIACGVLAVLFSFRVSDTGEWTLRAYPVDRKDCVHAGCSCGWGCGGCCDDSAEDTEPLESPRRGDECGSDTAVELDEQPYSAPCPRGTHSQPSSKHKHSSPHAPVPPPHSQHMQSPLSPALAPSVTSGETPAGPPPKSLGAQEDDNSIFGNNETQSAAPQVYDDVHVAAAPASRGGGGAELSMESL